MLVLISSKAQAGEPSLQEEGEHDCARLHWQQCNISHTHTLHTYTHTVFSPSTCVFAVQTGSRQVGAPKWLTRAGP